MSYNLPLSFTRTSWTSSSHSIEQFYYNLTADISLLNLAPAMNTAVEDLCICCLLSEWKCKETSTGLHSHRWQCGGTLAPPHTRRQERFPGEWWDLMCFTCYLSLSIFSQESSINPLPKVPKWKTHKAAHSHSGTQANWSGWDINIGIQDNNVCKTCNH